MLQKIMELLCAKHPKVELSITREELVKGRGYLLHYETNAGDGWGWREWIGFARFTDYSGGLTLEWEHLI